MTKKTASLAKRNVASKQHDESSEDSLKTGVKSSMAIHRKIKEGRKKQQLPETTTLFQYAMFFCSCVLVLAALGGYFWHNKLLRELVITPLNVPNILERNSSLPVTNPDRFWGSYRSGVYFGMKARSPTSPNFGIMWMQQLVKMPPDLRHWCSQDDRLKGYGWTHHDGTNFGVHEVEDSNFVVKSEFLKRPGGDHGGDWTARIKLLPKETGKQEKQVASLFLYMSLESNAGFIAATRVGDRMTAIRGRSDDIGSFQLSFRVDKQTHGKSILAHNYLVTAMPPNIGDLKHAVLHNLKFVKMPQKNIDILSLGGNRMPEGMDESKANLVVTQLTVTLPFEMEALYESNSVPFRAEKLTNTLFDTQLNTTMTSFNHRFEQTFQLHNKNFSEDQIDFARRTFSNLLGGISYFHGSSLVQSPLNLEPILYWPAPLYTAVPSRSFFPRGFLWDEGFHNLLISKWDKSISHDIIAHWMQLINMEGWIPREQILGEETTARVPREFVVQHNSNANPPTLFLTLEKLTDQLSSKVNREDRKYLEKLYPRLVAWFQWFNRTQQSSKHHSAYYWKGRNATTIRELNPKTLTSGLDDYPRASHPTDDERHLDLRCWLAFMARVLARVGKFVGAGGWEGFESTYKLLSDHDLLVKLHWSEANGRFSDYGLHSTHVSLKKQPITTPNKNLNPHERPPPQTPLEMLRVVSKEPKLRFVDSEFGYVSLFPMLLKLLPATSPQLGKILEDLPNEKLLWTSFGLRSLATTSPSYNKYNTEHDPPYWRGAIWININYLAVASLHHYRSQDGPYASLANNLYLKLRENIIGNVYRQYSLSGYVWEQYDDATGQGKGSHPFTGWSSLVVLLMAEEY